MREGVEKRASKRAPSPLFNSWSVTERERERERDGERENTVPPPPRLLFLPGVVVALQRSLCVKSEREFFCKKEGEIKGWAWEEASTRPLLQCRASVAAATIRPLLLSLSLFLSLFLSMRKTHSAPGCLQRAPPVSSLRGRATGVRRPSGGYRGSDLHGGGVSRRRAFEGRVESQLLVSSSVLSRGEERAFLRGEESGSERASRERERDRDRSEKRKRKRKRKRERISSQQTRKMLRLLVFFLFFTIFFLVEA